MANRTRPTLEKRAKERARQEKRKQKDERRAAVKAQRATNPRREGLYVIRIDDMLQVKRISMHPVTRLLTVKSDNPAYRTFDNIKPDEITIMGRVIWIGRSLG